MTRAPEGGLLVAVPVVAPEISASPKPSPSTETSVSEASPVLTMAMVSSASSPAS